MEITVNGENRRFNAGITMSNLLDELNIKREALAVELNNTNGHLCPFFDEVR